MTLLAALEYNETAPLGVHYAVSSVNLGVQGGMDRWVGNRQRETIKMRKLNGKKIFFLVAVCNRIRKIFWILLCEIDREKEIDSET